MHPVIIKQHRCCTAAHPHACLPLCTQAKLKSGRDPSEDAELLFLEMETPALPYMRCMALKCLFCFLFFFQSSQKSNNYSLLSFSQSNSTFVYTGATKDQYPHVKPFQIANDEAYFFNLAFLLFSFLFFFFTCLPFISEAMPCLGPVFLILW